MIIGAQSSGTQTKTTFNRARIACAPNYSRRMAVVWKPDIERIKQDKSSVTLWIIVQSIHKVLLNVAAQLPAILPQLTGG